MTSRRRAPVLALALLAASCGPRLIRLPSGSGVPEPLPEARAAVQQATARCRSITTLTAEIAVTGSSAGQRVRARLLAGVAAPASARIEATAPFGQPWFVFVASGDDATLLLPRDHRVLEHGRPEAVLDAVAGIPLTAADLEQTVTGCAIDEGNVRTATRFGDVWLRVSTDDGRSAFLDRDGPGAPWRIAVASTAAWRVDYTQRQSGLPSELRLVSVNRTATGERFDVRLALSQVETNTPLDRAAFRVEIPSDAVPITLDELRHARPGLREN